MKEQYIVLDIETTGLSKFSDKIIEISAIKIKENKITNKFETLINPDIKIPKFITSLTGIKNSMVGDSPMIEEIIPKFTRFSKNIPIVAHNASFDYGFLSQNIKVFENKEMSNEKICTMKLSRRLFPELPRHRLSFLCEHFDIKNISSHRAMSDTMATYDLFNRFIPIMKEKGIETQSQIISFSNSRMKLK